MVLEGIKETVIKPVSLFMLVIPIVIITLCLMRKHLVVALSWGIVAGIVVGVHLDRVDRVIIVSAIKREK